MAKISYELNFHLNNLEDKMEKAVINALTEKIEKNLKRERCPVHNRGVEIKPKGRDLSNLNYEISGCCREFLMDIKKSII